MNKYKNLKVFYHGRLVGTLVKTEDNLISFEYDNEWLLDGFSISPFSLPLQKKVFIPKHGAIYGLFGVFMDSLPRNYYCMLDKLLIKNNINPVEIDILNRLAITGKNGLGALTYKPSESMKADTCYDKLMQEFSEDVKAQSHDDLDEFFRLKSSPKTARFNINTKIDNEDWIIKIPYFHETKSGEEEYKYSLCAKDCGINMCETKLFPSNINSGYFAIKRFDRSIVNGENVKIHTVSASGLLELTHNEQFNENFDYNNLMKLTLELTKDYRDIEQLYRLMCFNVFAHNFDDHGKNFSFLYDESRKEWHLSPAYDLSFSFSMFGKHSTKINGKNINIELDDILAVAENIGMEKRLAKDIALDIQNKCLSLINNHKN